MSFNENLRTLRLARGLTQPALAEKTGIEQSYLSKLENGRSKPSEDVLTRLAHALDVKAEALLQNGDDAAERGRRWRLGLTAAVSVAALAAAFFLGRATAIYPLSLSDIAAGMGSSDNLASELLGVAPREVQVISINHHGNRLYIHGRAPDTPSVQAYMQVIQRSFGGNFQSIEISPTENQGSHSFELDYQMGAAKGAGN